MCQVHKLKKHRHLCVKNNQSTPSISPKNLIYIGQSHPLIYSSQKYTKLTNLLSNLITQYKAIDITDFITCSTESPPSRVWHYIKAALVNRVRGILDQHLLYLGMDAFTKVISWFFACNDANFTGKTYPIGAMKSRLILCASANHQLDFLTLVTWKI